MSNLEDLLQERLAELRNPRTDHEAQIAEVLAGHEAWYPALARGETHCDCGQWKDDSCMQNEKHRAHVAAMLAPAIAEAQAKALREAADSLDAHADKNEREVVRTAWGTRSNLKGTYWAVHRVRITARWLRARAAALTTP